MFGKGDSGQLGLGTSVLAASKPTKIDSLKQIRVRHAACGENFTAVVSGIASIGPIIFLLSPSSS